MASYRLLTAGMPNGVRYGPHSPKYKTDGKAQPRADFDPCRTDESSELPAREALEAQCQRHPGRRCEYICPNCTR